MAGPGEHTDVLCVISVSQTPSFTQLRSLNPHLAVLFSDRLHSNSPPLTQKHTVFLFNFFFLLVVCLGFFSCSTFCPVCPQSTAAEADDGGQVREIKQENEEMSKVGYKSIHLGFRDYMESPRSAGKLRLSVQGQVTGNMSLDGFLFL